MVHYSQRPQMPFRFGPPLTPTVKILIVINVTVFIIQYLLGHSAARIAFDHTFGLVPAKVFGQLHIWQFVTYMFLHFNFTHIFFNMFILWMFGCEIETLWGRKAFLQYYFVTGIGAGLVYFIVMPLIEPGSRNVALIGASGAGYGILMAYALMFPDRKVLLYFLVPIKVRWFVIGIGAIEFLMASRTDGVAHLAHLGGLLFGLIYFKGGKNWINTWTQRSRQRKARKGFRVVGDDRDRPDRGRNDDGAQDRINQILEKISREGLNSLDPEEQEILRRASRKN